MRRDSLSMPRPGRVSKASLAIFAAALTALTVLFAACGGDDDGDRIADQNDAAATSAAAATERAGDDTTPASDGTATPRIGGTATSDAGDTDSPEDTSVFDLREGDCITSSFGDETMLEQETGVVPCDHPDAASEVIALVNVPDADDYPGEAYFDEQTGTLCPEGTDSYYFPTAESWAAGDRTIICLQSVE